MRTGERVGVGHDSSRGKAYVVGWVRCGKARFLTRANPVRQLSLQPVAASAIHGADEMD